jgi:hypothetical protein
MAQGAHQEKGKHGQGRKMRNEKQQVARGERAPKGLPEMPSKGATNTSGR